MYGYNLNKDGLVCSISPIDIEKYNFQTNGTEPFTTEQEALLYRKDLSTGEWIYLPDVTPVNKTITDVKYDWQQMKAYITIADQFKPGPHEFDCTTTWTDQDCIDAINQKFP